MTSDTVALNTVLFLEPLYEKELSFVEQLAQYEVTFMLGETTKLLIRKNGLQPVNALNEYLNTFYKGEQVLLKSYGSFSSHPINRVIFIINLEKVFELQVEKSGFDYFQLIRLICSDYPKEQILNACQLILSNNDSEEALMKRNYNGQVFLKALVFVAIYEDFLKFLNQGIHQNPSVENISQLLVEKYYQQSTKPPFLPTQATIFEVLLKFSNQGQIQIKQPIQIFSPKMMTEKKSQYLTNGNVNYREFVKYLYHSQKTDNTIHKLLKILDRSQLRVSETIRIIWEKCSFENIEKQLKEEEEEKPKTKNKK